MKRFYLIARAASVLLIAVMVLGCASLLKRNPCRNPNYIQAMKEQAIAYYNQGALLDALKSAKEAEACRPRDAELYFWEGMIYLRKDKTYDAITYLQKAISIDKKFMDAYMALGAAYLQLEKWDEAIAAFKVVADDDYYPRPWEAYSNIGWAYLKKGDLALAEINLKQAIKSNDKFCPAYTNLGELYSKQGQRRLAIDQFQRAIMICPANYARPHFLMAIEYGYLGLFTQACSELNTAASVPNAPEGEQARDYMRLYNCPGIVQLPPGR